MVRDQQEELHRLHQHQQDLASGWENYFSQVRHDVQHLMNTTVSQAGHLLGALHSVQSGHDEFKSYVAPLVHFATGLKGKW